MKKSAQKKSVKKHGKYFCKVSLQWIAFLGVIGVVLWGYVWYHVYTTPKVLGISTSIYRNCSFWDFICPLKNFFSRPATSFIFPSGTSSSPHTQKQGQSRQNTQNQQFQGGPNGIPPFPQGGKPMRPSMPPAQY